MHIQYVLKTAQTLRNRIPPPPPFLLIGISGTRIFIAEDVFLVVEQ